MKNTEFKVTKSKNQTVFTLESATGGGTSAGSVASVSNPVGGVRRRVSNLVTSEAGTETVTVPVTQKPRQGPLKPQTGAGAHRDKKKEQKQGQVKHKKPYIEDHSDAANRGWGAGSYDTYANTRHGRGVAEGIGGLGYDAQSLITKLRRDVEEKRLKPTPEAVLAAARELAGDMEFAPQLLVKQVLGQGVAEGERTMSRAAKGHEKYGKDGMKALAKAGREGASDEKLDAIRDKHDKYDEGFNGEYDDEAGMAQGNLYTIAQAAQGLLDTIDDRDNLPEWAQEKIAKVEGMLVTVWNYLQSQEAQGIDPQQDMEEGLGRMRGSSSAYDRDYSSSISGMGRGPDHRGLGQELGHETNNYAVAVDGRTWKVFADQRQAQNIAKSLQAKGKNATVHPTGENPSEGIEEDDSALQAFLAKGGKIQVGKTHPPRKAEKWQGSSHIGAAGGKGTKGSVSGLGANTKTGNKPVVSVEDAYMMELASKLAEKIPSNAPVDAWIQDFQQANPEKYHQFRQNNRPGTKKPEAKIAQMAVAASYAAKNPSKKK